MIEWIQANWAIIVGGYFAIVGLASWIVKLTKTPHDDRILGKIMKFVDQVIALNNKRK